MSTSPPEQPPRLSFLTPAYRTEAYLPDTIRSVVTQTRGDWELVVVDNGNSDPIASIVLSFDDPRIRLVRQENRGYTGGVTAAAVAARGDYYCILDSDDQLMPQFAETMCDYLDVHPEVDAVGCDAHLFIDGEEHNYGRGYLHSIGYSPPASDAQDLTLEQVLSGRVPYYTAAIRRAAWDAVGGYEPGVDDVDESVLIWLRLASDFEVRLLPDKLARYRVREESLSRDPEKVEGFEKALIRTFEMFANQSGNPHHAQIVEIPLRRLRYHQALRRARWDFRDGDIDASRRFAREAFAQQHTPRAAIIVALLQLSPRFLKSVYPLKQKLWQWARTTRQRILAH